MARTVQCFYPGRDFPSVSVTGTHCALDCKHCGGRYLQGMRPATTPDALLRVAQELHAGGASGMLISGGSTIDGRLDLARFTGAIRTIKETTNLLVNAHIGLASRAEIDALVASGIDAFSVDVHGSEDTIREVFGIDAGPDDYLRVMDDLVQAGAPIVAPHICIGLRGGRIEGEYMALSAVAARNPGLLVLISLMPTKGTAYEGVPAPSGEDVLGIVSEARRILPGTRLLIGCMRDRTDRGWEVAAVEAGADGIVMPSAATVRALRESGYEIVERRTCCAFA